LWELRGGAIATTPQQFFLGWLAASKSTGGLVVACAGYVGCV